jgi:hypothetical protein
MGSRMNNESSCVDLPQSSIQYMSKIYNENCWVHCPRCTKYNVQLF